MNTLPTKTPEPGFGPVIYCKGVGCDKRKREGNALRDGWQVCLHTEYMFCSDACHESYHGYRKRAAGEGRT